MAPRPHLEIVAPVSLTRSPLILTFVADTEEEFDRPGPFDRAVELAGGPGG